MTRKTGASRTDLFYERRRLGMQRSTLLTAFSRDQASRVSLRHYSS